jgi:propionyl-CoA carboxylase alpha chain
VRVDSGLIEGMEISTHYDPMIAKLVTHGPTREACIDRMESALEE